MDVFFFKPRVYLLYDKNGDSMGVVRLADLSDFFGGDGKLNAEEIWRKYFFLMKDIDECKQVIASLKANDLFLLDPVGNVVDETGNKTGYRIDGPQGESIGSWKDIFVSEEWAMLVLDGLLNWGELRFEES